MAETQQSPKSSIFRSSFSLLRLLRPGSESGEEGSNSGGSKSTGSRSRLLTRQKPQESKKAHVQRRSDAEIMRAARSLWCTPKEPDDVVAFVLGALDDDTLTATIAPPSRINKSGREKKASTNPFDDDSEDVADEGTADDDEFGEEEFEKHGSTNPFEDDEPVSTSRVLMVTRNRRGSSSSTTSTPRTSIDEEGFGNSQKKLKEAARVMPTETMTVGTVSVDLDTTWLENAIWEAERALALFTDELSCRVKNSHDEFVDGMRLVHDVGGEIEQSTKICKNGRESVRSCKAALTETALKVANCDRKRTRAAEVLELMKSISAVTRCVSDLNSRMSSSAYADAIDIFFSAREQADKLLALRNDSGASQSGEKKKRIKKSKTEEGGEEDEVGERDYDDDDDDERASVGLRCTAELQTAMDSATRALERRLEASLRETAQHFDAVQYETVQAAYAKLGRSHEVLNKLDAIFVSELRERMEKIVLLYMGANASSTLLQQQANATSARTMRMDFSRACAAVPDEQYIDCLFNILALCVDVMWNFLTVKRWHEQKAETTAGAKEDEETATTAAGLERIHGKIWESMQTHVAILVRCAVLARFPSEDALRIVEALNTFVEIGREFSNSSTTRRCEDILESTIQERCSTYFQDMQRSMWEDLATMYEKEQWQRVPVVMRLTDLAEFRNLDSVTAAANSKVKSLVNGTTQKLFFASASGTNPFLDSTNAAAKQQQTEEDDEVDSEVNDDRSSSSGKNKLGDEEDDDELNEDVADEDECGSADEQMLTSSAITVTRKIGRYFRMLQVFRPIAGDVMDAMFNLYNSYLWTVWACFVQPNVTDSPQQSMKSRVLEGLRGSTGGGSSSSRDSERHEDGSGAYFCGGGVLGAIGAENGGEVPLPPAEATTGPSSVSNSVTGDHPPRHLFISPTGAHLAADGADRKRLVMEEVAVPERPYGFRTPTIYAGADLGTQTNLYGLHHRVVATESLMFLRDAMDHIKPALLAALACAGASATEATAWRRRAERFYRCSVDTAEHVRLLMYRQMVPYLMSMDYPVVSAIEHTRWDSAPSSDRERPYVETVRSELSTLSERVDCLKKLGCLTARPIQYLWESVCIHVMDVLLEGYSRVRRCGNEGRAAMLMDTQAIIEILNEKSGGMRPTPGSQSVESYIKAFYLPEDDLLSLARAHQEFTGRMLANVFSCGLAQRLARKQRNEYQAAIEEIAKSRPRRPLWHFVTQALLLESRDAAHKAAVAEQLRKMRATDADKQK